MIDAIAVLMETNFESEHDVNPYECTGATTPIKQEEEEECNYSVNVQPYERTGSTASFTEGEYNYSSMFELQKCLGSVQHKMNCLCNKPVVVKQKKELEPSMSNAIKKELAGLEVSMRSLKEKFEFLKESLPDDYDTKELTRYITALKTLVA